jgi:thioredoxin 1
MNSTEFEQKVLAAGKAVVIDFWAPWCAPCRATKPVLEKLAAEYAGRVEFLPVNADDSPEVLRQYRILGIPTVLAFLKGQPAGRVTGAQPESGYRLLFEALAAGVPVKLRMAPFDRMLRLGTGAVLIVLGGFTGSWLLAGLGALVAFFGIYDRCPVWAALTRAFRRK